MATRALRVVPPDAPGAVISDPGNFTPYYVDALCSGLCRLDVRTWVVSSPPLFSVVDPGGRYQVQHCFFPALKGRLGQVLRHRTRLRQALKAITYPAGIWRTWCILRRLPAGVLHVQWALVPFLDGLLARALRSCGWRIVYTVHDPLPGPDRWLAACHHRWFLRCAEALIVHTSAIRQRLVAGYPEVAGRVQVIPHGGIPHPLPTEADRSSARLRLALDVDRPLLLLFGMLKPYKGLEDLLAAMPGILARVPRCQLVVAGEALMPMHPIERQIDRLQLSDAVVLRPGFVPDAEVGAYFTAADLVVAPYRDIGASGVVVTAQGYGRAVLVTRVGGLPEFVEPDSCGLVVPPQDPDALAEAAVRALANPGELSRMGQRAWKRIAEAHDWTNVARQTLALYQAVRTTPSESKPAWRSNAR
ncbi:MAG TPA: glycosyltransferase family 4 protein [Methylomirabilota bacterium]|nr:glycosyltransferase family 4 protein [Methylomirabilota bacterium]